MKKIRNLLLAVLIVSIMPLVNAIAQDTDYSASYDFNDYEGEMSSGVTPGEDWSYFSGGNAFGASDGAMKLNWGAKPALHLKNPVNCVSPTDAMHISFRAKVVTGGQLFVGTAKNNGNHDEDVTKVDVFGRARHNMIKISKYIISSMCALSQSPAKIFTNSFLASRIALNKKSLCSLAKRRTPSIWSSYTGLPCSLPS